MIYLALDTEIVELKQVYCPLLHESRPHTKEILDKKNITIVELASITGLNSGGLLSLKNKKTCSIDFRTIELLCKALDCDIDDLLKFEFEDDIKKKYY